MRISLLVVNSSVENTLAVLVNSSSLLKNNSLVLVISSVLEDEKSSDEMKLEDVSSKSDDEDIKTSSDVVNTGDGEIIVVVKISKLSVAESEAIIVGVGNSDDVSENGSI